MTRKHISLKTKLAAALLCLRDGSGDLVIPYADGKQMSANHVISLFQWDHYPIPHAEGGPDEPWNLEPRLIADHREKTRKVDNPVIAKGKRIRKAYLDHRDALGIVQTRLMTREEAERMFPGQVPPAEPHFTERYDRPLALGPANTVVCNTTDEPITIYDGPTTVKLKPGGVYRPIRSRGFDKAKTKSFSGKVRARKRRRKPL